MGIISSIFGRGFPHEVSTDDGVSDSLRHVSHKDLVTHARLVYETDRHHITGMFIRRWCAHLTLTDDDRKKLRSLILVENESATITDTRINEMPCEFAYTPEVTEAADDDADGAAQVKTSEEFTTALMAWAKGPHGIAEGIEGISLLDSLPQFEDDQEKDGNAVVVMGRKDDGAVWFSIRDSACIKPKVEVNKSHVLSEIVFEWHQEETEGGSDTPKLVKYKETIKAGSYQLLREGVQVQGVTTSGAGFIPVAIAPRRFRKGTPLGDPGVVDVEESLLNYLWSLYMLNRANKYESFGLYCLHHGADMDQVNEPTCWTIEPGGYYPEPIDKVGGNINTQTLQAQIQGRLEAMRRKGHVREKGSSESDGRSAKAQLIGNEIMRKYVARKLIFLRMMLLRIATYWGRLATNPATSQPWLGLDEIAPVVVAFPELNTDDPQVIQNKADWLLKAVVAGKLTDEMFFEALQAIGFAPSGRDAKDMAAALQQQDEASAEAAATAAINAARAARDAQGEDEEEEETDDVDTAEDDGDEDA